VRFDFTPAEQERFMRVALEAGRHALPDCAPNPPVGCALVRDREVIATGFTSPPGLPHAEPAALNQVPGEDLSDVAAFVTLEPCSFHQRTPSCARELIARRIGAVYVAIRDPHPRNRGAGLELLREAGIDVIEGVCADQASRELGPHLWRKPHPPTTDQ